MAIGGGKGALGLDVVKELVEEALADLGVVISDPPSSEEKRVDNVYVIEVEGNPRLEVKYEEE